MYARYIVCNPDNSEVSDPMSKDEAEQCAREWSESSEDEYYICLIVGDCRLETETKTVVEWRQNTEEPKKGRKS